MTVVAPATVAVRRVVLVDDEPDVRAALRRALERDGRLTVVAEAADGEELLAQLSGHACDAILLDLSMPRMSGHEVLSRLRGRAGLPPTIALSTYSDAANVDRALTLGASGYLLKSARIEEIVMAVESAIVGRAYLQPEVARGVLDRHLVATDARPAIRHLSRRQMQVLEALCEGLTAKEVAARLGLADSTVGAYIKKLYERLGVTSRAAAVAIAIRAGLVR